MEAGEAPGMPARSCLMTDMGIGRPSGVEKLRCVDIEAPIVNVSNPRHTRR